MTDPRPANCRFRLQDEGKLYPRSSCVACGRSIATGLGKCCHHEQKLHHEVEINEIKRNRDELLASCVEFLPILERHLEVINPGGASESSIAYQTAKSRVDRMRLAIENAKKENQ